MKFLRMLRRGIPKIKPWVQRVLDVLDVADWKTWVWYSLLGMERLVSVLLVAAKKRGYQPADIHVKNGRFFIVRRGAR